MDEQTIELSTTECLPGLGSTTIQVTVSRTTAADGVAGQVTSTIVPDGSGRYDTVQDDNTTSTAISAVA